MFPDSNEIPSSDPRTRFYGPTQSLKIKLTEDLVVVRSFDTTDFLLTQPSMSQNKSYTSSTLTTKNDTLNLSLHHETEDTLLRHFVELTSLSLDLPDLAVDLVLLAGLQP